MHEELHEVAINREFFGVLTATLIEPSLAIVVNIIQALLAAQQGVRSFTVGYAEQGNRVQDVAAISILNESVNHYLNTLGYHECRVTTVFHQFMAAFPQDYEKAKSLIANSAITATLAGATKIMVKTPVEAFRIPTRYDNSEALAICRRALGESHVVRLKSEAVKIEEKILRMEVRQIMDVIIELGNGSIPMGSLKAVEEGVLDVPWSPSIYNRNEAISIRDVDGAVRYHHFGRLPFTNEIKEFHNEKVQIRKKLERDSGLFSLLEKDLSRIWKNDYKSWPLDGCYVN
jgi:methylaspartate mutase epsilon subunit